MELKDKTLLEKDVMDEKKSKTLELENDSASKLFSRFRMDFDYTSALQSSPSCKGAAYSFMPKEKPLYTSGLDIAFERATNPLGSFYDMLHSHSRYSYSLPCDLGAMGGFGRM